MKPRSDLERFTRYQTVINKLREKDSFRKFEIFEFLKNEQKAFIGRIINELEKAGYLIRSESKAKSLYRWTKSKDAFHPGRWIDQQVFTVSVKRSPRADRPRERLLRLGPAELKTSELLAILVRSGLPGESALQAGEKLTTRFRDQLEKLSMAARGELKQVSRAIGETAYCQIMAALELGKRLAVQQKDALAPRSRIRNSSDAVAFCKQHFQRLAREGEQEEFHVVLLDEKHQIIKSEQITVGLLSQSLVHPREVFRPAIRESAAAVILVHNHPSGDPLPSQDDQKITRELKKAAETLSLRILDHIIISKDRCLSMMDEKLL